MSSLDFDHDTQIHDWELQWRQASEMAVVARAELQALASNSVVDHLAIARAQHRLERGEGLKARIMAQIERLEDGLLGLES